MGERISTPSGIGFSTGPAKGGSIRGISSVPRVSSSVRSSEFGSSFKFGSSPKIGSFSKSEFGSFKTVAKGSPNLNKPSFAPRSKESFGVPYKVGGVSRKMGGSAAKFEMGNLRTVARGPSQVPKAHEGPPPKIDRIGGSRNSASSLREILRTTRPLNSKDITTQNSDRFVSGKIVEKYTKPEVLNKTRSAQYFLASTRPFRMADIGGPRMDRTVAGKDAPVFQAPRGAEVKVGQKTDGTGAKPLEKATSTRVEPIRAPHPESGRRHERRHGRHHRRHNRRESWRRSRIQDAVRDQRTHKSEILKPNQIRPTEIKTEALRKNIPNREVQAQRSQKLEVQARKAPTLVQRTSPEVRVSTVVIPEPRKAQSLAQKAERPVLQPRSQERPVLRLQTVVQGVPVVGPENHTRLSFVTSQNQADKVLAQRFVEPKAHQKVELKSMIKRQTQEIALITRPSVVVREESMITRIPGRLDLMPATQDGASVRTQPEQARPQKLETLVRTQVRTELRMQPQYEPDSEARSSDVEQVKKLYETLEKAYGEQKAQDLVIQHAKMRKLFFSEEELLQLIEAYKREKEEKKKKKKEEEDKRDDVPLPEIRVVAQRAERAYLSREREIRRSVKEVAENEEKITGEAIVAHIGDEDEEQRSPIIFGIEIRDGSRDTMLEAIYGMGEFSNPYAALEAALQMNERYQPVEVKEVLQTKLATREDIYRVYHGQKQSILQAAKSKLLALAA